jgi:hypothetical protein
VSVFPDFKNKDAILIYPGGKRTLPRLNAGSMFYMLSDTANTTVQVWHSATKWGSDWAVDEVRRISGDVVGWIGDPMLPAGVPVVYDFPTLIGRNAKYFTMIPVTNPVDVTIFIRGSVAGGTCRVLAGEVLTINDAAVEVIRVSIVNAVALDTFAIRGLAY